MASTAIDDSLDALASTWQRAERVVALAGAGLSTASGIPDFRSPGGRWENYQPTSIQDFQSSDAARREYWRYKGETWRVIREAPPNAAHRALVDLARADRLDLFVTQNVDGLERRAGFPADRLVTIHGTDAEVVCLDCGERSERDEAQARWETGEATPTCHNCGGWLKPATISFGQALVQQDLERAFHGASTADLLLAVGTSLVVFPIAHMVELALRNESKVAILTASDTPFDALAHVKLSEPLEDILPKLRDLVLA